MTTYGQTLVHDGGQVTVSGHPDPDGALWTAARMLRVPVKKLRKILSEDQRARLLKIARSKINS